MSRKRHELKQEIWKAVEILNQIFENEFKKKKVRHVDDNQLVLTKQQSQARLNNLLITLSSVLGLLTLVLIFLSGYSSREIRNGTYFHENVTEVGMRTHKLFLVHHDGRTQKLEWKNNSNSLQVTNMPSIIRGKCFHYPVQDNEQLNVLNGDSEHKTSTFIPNLRQWKDISNTTITNKVDTLACFTRIRNYIWVTGGLGTCGKTKDIIGTHQSYLWSMTKKKWIQGPELNKSYRFVKDSYLVACSLALNSSTVIFIGLSNSSDPELHPSITGFESFDDLAWSHVKNDIVASYNFDHKSWVQHESLDYPSFGVSGHKTVDLHYGYEVLCSCYHGKNESWIVAISFMIDKKEHFAKKYHPFAWFSSIKDIKWKPLDIPAKTFDIPGTLINLKGMMYVIAYPNSGQILGYQVDISNTSLLTSIMPEGGVKPCEVIYGNGYQPCRNEYDFLGYIRGFGLNSISAVTIIE